MSAHSKKWWVLLAMCLVTVMLAIDATAINIAIPVIAADFHASLSNMQWVINAFFLLSAMVQILGGHLGDSYGHKKFFIINIFLFIASSLGVGFSNNEHFLILFRALQGATIGLAFPATYVLIFSAFPKEQQSFARSFAVATMGIFLAAGAPIGGLFVSTIGWRWIFYINLPIGLLSALLAWKYCREDKELSKSPIDVKGASLLILSLFAVTFGLNQVQNWGFLSPQFLIFISAGVIFLFLLYFSERNKQHRIVDFRLFRIRNYFLNSVIRIFVGITFLSILFFFPLYLQNVIGISPIASGFLMLFMTAIMALLSPIAGKWVDKEGDKIPTLVSMVLFIILAILCLFIGGEPNYYLLATTLFLSGIAIGTTYISTTTGALSVAPEKKMGAASGIFLTVAWIACALGVAVSGTAIAMKSEPYLLAQLKQEGIELDPDQLHLAQRAARGIESSSSLQVSSEVQAIVRDSFAAGVHATAWVLIVLNILGLILSLFLVKRRPTDPPPQRRSVFGDPSAANLKIEFL